MVAQLQTYYLFDVQALVDAASGTIRGFSDSSKIPRLLATNKGKVIKQGDVRKIMASQEEMS